MQFVPPLPSPSPPRSPLIKGDSHDRIKRDEGFKASPYRDTAGKLTVGYGLEFGSRTYFQAYGGLLPAPKLTP
jgi:hypothetical protein